MGQHDSHKNYNDLPSKQFSIGMALSGGILLIIGNKQG